MVFQEGDIILFNTQTDHCLPSDNKGKYHVHILCHAGKAQFSMMEKRHVMEAGDWAIWQIGSDIYDTDYSSDFDADILLVERNFLIENIRRSYGRRKDMFSSRRIRCSVWMKRVCDYCKLIST